MHCVDFSNRFGSEVEAVLAEYAKTLWVDNLGLDDLRRGIERLRMRAGHERFTPTPVEFRDMCLPGHEELGLPSIDDVRAELSAAIDFYRRHPVKRYSYDSIFTEMIAREILRSYRMAPDDVRPRILGHAYAKHLDLARRGKLPENRGAIAQMPEPRPAYEQYLRDTRDIPHDPELLQRVKRIKQLNAARAVAAAARD